MALSHTDTPVSTLKINKFATKADYDAAIAQGLITENELSFVEETTQANWTQSDSSAPDYIKNKPSIPTNSDFSLSGLSDTNVPSPNNGDALTYNTSTSKWVPTAITGTDEKLAITAAEFDDTSAFTTEVYDLLVTNDDDVNIGNAKTRQYTNLIQCALGTDDMQNPSTASLSIGNTTEGISGDLYIFNSGGTYTNIYPHGFGYTEPNSYGISVFWPTLTNNRTIYFPDNSGTIALTSDIPSVNYPVTDVQVNGTSVLSSKVANIITNTAYNASSNKIATMSDLPAAQVNSDWNSSSGVSQILNKPTLATVATSGSYNDLSNKPTIPTNSDFSLAGLSDTTVASPSNGQVLTYNGSAWVNSTSPAGVMRVFTVS